jgi:hypothetical protein
MWQSMQITASCCLLDYESVYHRVLATTQSNIDRTIAIWKRSRGLAGHRHMLILCFQDDIHFRHNVPFMCFGLPLFDRSIYLLGDSETSSNVRVLQLYGRALRNQVYERCASKAFMDNPDSPKKSSLSGAEPSRDSKASSEEKREKDDITIGVEIECLLATTHEVDEFHRLTENQRARIQDLLVIEPWPAYSG